MFIFADGDFRPRSLPQSKTLIDWRAIHWPLSGDKDVFCRVPMCLSPLRKGVLKKWPISVPFPEKHMHFMRRGVRPYALSLCLPKTSKSAQFASGGRPCATILSRPRTPPPSLSRGRFFQHSRKQGSSDGPGSQSGAGFLLSLRGGHQTEWFFENGFNIDK